MEYQVLKQKIEELRYKNFDFHKEDIWFEELEVSSLIREVQVCYRNIASLQEEDYIINELRKQLDDIFIAKIKKLNPNIKRETIKNMIAYCQEDLSQYPIDFYIISQAVFAKRASYNDAGSIYKVQTFMYDNIGNYFNIFDPINFDATESIQEIFSKGKIILSNEERLAVATFISKSINNALMDEYKIPVTKSAYDPNDTIFHKYAALLPEDDLSIKIYLSKKFKDIGRDIKKRLPSDIEMIVQDDENISLYFIEQKFEGTEVVWNINKTPLAPWILSEAATFEESKQIPSYPVLKKIPKETN